MKTVNKKLILGIGAAILAVVVIIAVAVTVLSRRDTVAELQAAPAASEAPSPVPSPKATPLPSATPTPEPTPNIPLPDENFSDPSSGSDIILQIVQPVSDTDIED